MGSSLAGAFSRGDARGDARGDTRGDPLPFGINSALETERSFVGGLGKGFRGDVCRGEVRGDVVVGGLLERMGARNAQ